MKTYILKKIDKLVAKVRDLDIRINETSGYFNRRDDKITERMAQIEKRLQALENSQSLKK